MSERDPNAVTGWPPERGAGYPADPQLESSPAPVAEIEAEIKAEIAAELEAEEHRATSGTSFPDGSDEGWPDPPPPVADPATEVLAWLRGEFDDVNANLQSLSNRLGRQEEAVLRITGAQEAELNSTLAELEGCSAQLRNEAAVLRDTRTQLAQSLPRLVTEAVESAVTDTVAEAVAEMRGTVAQLGAALSEALPAALADAVTPALTEAVPAQLVPQSEPDGARVDDVERTGGDDGPDLVSQLHEAQDEAAEWFSIVVDEAVRRAVERWLVPAVSAPAPDVPDASDAGIDVADSEGGHVGSGAVGSEPVATEPVATEPVAETPVEPASVAPDPEIATAVPRIETVGPRDVTARASSGAETARPATPPAEPSPSHVVATDAGASGPGVGADAPGPAVSLPPAANGSTDRTKESGVTCVLPGVAVGPTLAMGISTALARARLRRRRRRMAGAPAAGLFRHDPFAGELSRRLERFALAGRDLAWTPDPGSAGPGDGGDPQAVGPSTSTPVVIGERDGRELVVDLAAGPLCLIGPDADDAGRALVATFLAGGGPSARRVVAADDLLPPGPPFPGLDRFDDLSAALDAVEADVSHRTGPPFGQTGAGRPLVVLVISAPPPGVNERLNRLAERGPALGVTLVVVGRTTMAGRVVNLDSAARVRDVVPPDGTDLVGARMFRLAPSAMSEVLDVLAASRTDDDPTPMIEVRAEPFPVLTATGPTTIQVRVLGPYRIDVGGEEVRSGLRAKARELLAFYLLHPEGTTLDVATEALWPEADAGRGSEWFWTALGNLRSRLRSITGTKALKIIERDGDRYRIEPVFDVDLWRFQAALPPPGASTGDPEWAAALQGAADMYDGELLAGVDWAWADVPREDLRRRAVDVLVSLGATRLVAGDVRGALDVLSHAIEVDPVGEQLYRRIMRLHAKQSHLDEVEATFERLKARLSELGLEPTEESAQLVAELVG